MMIKRVWILVTGLVVFLWASSAHADAADIVCSGTIDSQPFYNETFIGTFTMDNASSSESYFAPTLELEVPPEFDIAGATSFGAAVEVFETEPFGPSTPQPHPLTGESITRPPDSRLVVIRFPVASQTPDSPPVKIEVTFAQNTLTQDSATYDIKNRCAYLLGETVTSDDFLTDPPLRSPYSSNSVTPTLVRIELRSPVETCAGSNFPVTVELDVDVATGTELASVSGFVQMPVGFNITSATTNAATVAVVGQNVLVSAGGAVVGGAGVEETVLITGTISPSILSALSPSNVTLTVDAEIGGAIRADPPDPSTTLIPIQMLSQDIEVVPTRLTSNVNPAVRTPDDMATITMRMCRSEGMAASNLQLQSQLPDGVTYVTNSATPSQPTVSGDPELLTWDPLDANINLQPNSERLVSYDVVVDQSYLDNSELLTGDELDFDHTLTGVSSPSGAPFPGQNAGDTITVNTGTFTKIVDPTDDAQPGDLRTYQIELTLPSGDQGTFVIDDYLPFPVFDLVGLDSISSNCAVVVNNCVEFGPNHTYPAAGFDRVETDPINNLVSFFFNGTTGLTQTYVVDLRISVRVTGEVIDDGSRFENLAVLTLNSNSGVVSKVANAPLKTLGPVLDTQLGAVSLVSENGIINNLNTLPTPPVTPPVSPAIAGTVSNVDAGDEITYNYVLGNVGSAPAYATVVRFDIPPGLTVTRAPTFINPNGDDPVISGDALTAQGAEIISPIGVDSVVYAEFTVRVDDDVPANSEFDVVGTLMEYRPLPTGGDAADPDIVLTSPVDTREFAETVLVVGGDAEVSIGEPIELQVVLTVPEGEHPNMDLTSTLPVQGSNQVLALVSDFSLIGVTFDGFDNAIPAQPTAVQSISGYTLEFGDLTNADRDTNDETITLTYQVTPVNVQQTTATDDALVEAFTLSWSAQSHGFDGAAVDVDEPLISLTVSAAPPTIEGGDTVTLTFQIQNAGGGNSADAHDVLLTLPTNPDIDSLSNFTNVAGSATNVDLVGGTVAYTVLPHGDTVSFTVDALISSLATIGGTLQFDSDVEWTSAAGPAAAISALNPNSVERDGSDIDPITGVSSGFNDHRVLASDSVNLSNVSVTKDLGAASVSGLATIGETVDFDVVITVPVGSLDSLVVSDALPSGLSFVSTSGFAVTPGLECSTDGVTYAPCALPSPSVGATVDWDFGFIRNSTPGTLSWTVTSLVENQASNQNSTTLVNSVTANGQSANAPLVTIVEPNVSADMAATGSTFDGGDTVTMTVQLSSDGTATAYDLMGMVDTLDGVTGVTGSENLGTCTTAFTNFSVSVGVALVTWNADSAANGETCQFTFDVLVDAGVTIGGTASLDGEINWTSTPGVNADERVGVNGDTLNDYLATIDETLDIADLAVTKTIAASSDAFASIGESVEYTVEAQIPNGQVASFVVVDTLPAGLEFVSAQNLVTPGTVQCSPDGVTFAPCAIPSPVVIGNAVTWDFETLRNTAAGTTFSFDLTAQVANDIGNQDGTILSNSVDISGVTATAPDVTVVEPALAATLTRSAGTFEGGDVVTFDIELTSSGTSPAYDFDGVLDVLNDLSPNSASFSSGTCASLTNFSIFEDAGSIRYQADEVPAGSCTFTIGVRVNDDAPIGGDVGLSGTYTWTSAGGVIAEERTGVLNDALNDYIGQLSNTFTLQDFSLSKTLTSAPTLSIGEVATHRIEVQLPNGQLDSFPIIDTIPTGTRFISADNLTTGGVQCSNDGTTFSPCVIPTEAINGGQTTLDFGFVRNTSGATTLGFDVNFVVENVTLNQEGATFQNSVDLLGMTATSGTSTLTEPLVTATIDNDAMLPDAGDIVNVTVTLSSVGTSDAHDLTGVFDVFNLVAPIAGTADVGTCGNSFSGFQVTADATQVLWSADTAPTGQTCEFTFQVAPTVDLGLGESVDWSGSFAWTSATGTNADERIGVDGDVLNDYFDVLVDGFATTEAVALELNLIDSSVSETMNPTLWLAETGTFEAVITLPDGTHDNVTATITLPPGLAITEVLAVNTSNFGGTIEQAPAVGPLDIAANTDAVFDLGEVVADATDGSGDNTFTIEFLTVSEFDSVLRQSPGQVVAGVLAVTNLAVDATDTQDVTIDPPSLSVEFTSTDQTTDQFDPALVEFTVSNFSDAPACNFEVVFEQLPMGLEVDPMDTDGLDNDDDGDIDETDEATFQMADNVTVPIVGCVGPAERRVIRANVRGIEGALPGPRVIVATLGSYESLPMNGETLEPLSDAWDTDVDNDVDEAEDNQATLTLTVESPLLLFQKSYEDLDGEPTGPGDTIRYTITLRNVGIGDAIDVEIQDVLPELLTPIPGSETTTFGSVTLDGNTLTVTMDALPDDEMATVTVDARIATPLAAGTIISNQATMEVAGGFGDRVSNDPTTNEDFDPTEFEVACVDDCDGDGRPDVVDPDPTDPNICGDLDDNDTCDDCALSGIVDPGNDGPDEDGDGLCDDGDPDDNNDGFEDDVVIGGGQLFGCAATPAKSPAEPLFLFVVVFGLIMRRRVSKMIPVLMVIAVMVPPLPAFTQAQQVQENQEIRAQRMRISHGTYGILDVESASVPGHLVWEATLWMDYQNDPIVLYLEREGEETLREGSLLKHRLGAVAQGSIGISDWLHVGIEVPLVLYQGREDQPDGVTVPLDEITVAGLSDIRVMPKARFLNTEDHYLNLAVISSVTFPTSTDDAYLGDRTVTWEPEIAVSRSWQGPRIAGNVSYLLRGDEVLNTTEWGDEFRVRFGAAYRWDEADEDSIPLELMASIETAGRVGDDLSDFQNRFGEGRVGASYRVGKSENIWLFAGAGLGIFKGTGSPDWRTFAGVRLTPTTECIDTDGDTYCDDVDECPYEPEDFDGTDDLDGCTDAVVVVIPEPKRIRVGAQIEFEYDSDKLKQGRTQRVMDRIAEVLEERTDLELIRIEGHTSSEGSERYNQDLSERRAASVRQALIDRGIAPDRLESVGFGESQPIATNDTDEGREQNRRVEFVILRRDGKEVEEREVEVDEEERKKAQEIIDGKVNPEDSNDSQPTP